MRTAHECVPHLFNFMMPEPEAAAIIGFLAAYASDANVSLSPKRNTQVNPTPELLGDAFRPPDRVREVCQAYSG
jgi:hypothetical protein